MFDKSNKIKNKLKNKPEKIFYYLNKDTIRLTNQKINESELHYIHISQMIKTSINLITHNFFNFLKYKSIDFI